MAKILSRGEGFPGKRISPNLFGSREGPLPERREEEKLFFQERSLGGGGMRKRGVRSSPPLRSCRSFDIPPIFLPSLVRDQENSRRKIYKLMA
jgi:hypothetical protein